METENQPLLQENEPIQEKNDSPKATLLSSWANLTNTILGAGMLGIPFAFAAAGSIVGSFLLLCCMFLSGLGLYLLGLVAFQLQLQNKVPTYLSASQATSPLFVTLLIDFAIALKCFGVATGYLVVTADLMPKVMATIASDGPGILQERWFWILLSMVLVIPLTFQKSLHALRYSSILALFSTFYLIFLILYYYDHLSAARKSKNFDGDEKIDFNFVPHDPLRLISSLPIFVFAFTCHQNLFPIFHELPNAAGLKINSVIGGSGSFSFLVYFIIGIFGYLTYGDNVDSNIVNDYPDNVLVSIGRIAIVLNVVLSYALQAFPARKSMDSIFFTISTFYSLYLQKNQNENNEKNENENNENENNENNENEKNKKNENENNENNENENNENNENENNEKIENENNENNEKIENHHSIQNIQFFQKTNNSFFRFLIENLFFLILTYFLVFINVNLGFIFSFVGATGSTAICYIFPGWFYFRISQSDGWTWRRIAAFALLIWGALFLVVALSIVLYQNLFKN